MSGDGLSWSPMRTAVPRRSRVAITAVLLLLGAGCGKVERAADGDDDAAPDGGAPVADDDFRVTVVGDAYPRVGGAATVRVVLERGADFDAAVSLAIRDLPDGVSASTG